MTQQALVGQPAQAEEIVALFERMSHAFSTLNYDGVFIYSHGNNMDSLRIVHRFEGGSERERVARLDGPSHEIIRDGEKVICVHAAGWKGDINHRIPSGPFAKAFVRDVSNLDAHYKLSRLQDGRIVDRDALSYSIVPIDDFRYSYRVWLDKETGLLLKSILVYQGRVLERFQFTQLRFDDEIPDAALELGIEGPVMAHYPLLSPAKPPLEEQELGWELSWTPSGFSISVRGIRRGESDSASAGTLTYSDGMAAFSVFVERAPPTDEPRQEEMVTQVGATVAVERLVEFDEAEHFVTVVGELPLSTAKRIAASVVPVERLR